MARQLGVAVGVVAALLTGAIWVYSVTNPPLAIAANAVLPDGGRYRGAITDGRFHGDGVLSWPNGAFYKGGFRNGVIHGTGTFTYAGGDVYQGHFARGLPNGTGTMAYADGSQYTGHWKDGLRHGEGRLTDAWGGSYEGQFAESNIVEGTFSDGSGSRYTGAFHHWRFHGAGELYDADGTIYKGTFEHGNLVGKAVVIEADGARYEGEVKDWFYHGKGRLKLANGDVYTGEFAHGTYHGSGTLVYAQPRGDIEKVSGTWIYGENENSPKQQAQQRREQAVQQALYSQNRLLKNAAHGLKASDPEKAELYFLGIAGYGMQDVFTKEIRFIEALLDSQFGTRGRSMTLINHQDTIDTYPLATARSLEESLRVFAEKMGQEDILLLYMTSHGTSDHQFSIALDGLTLPAIGKNTFAEIIDRVPIRWKVLIISACYSGGFLPSLENESTLVITAAAADRRSFGCEDDSEMTFFGRAYFQQALPTADSFETAFHRASDLIQQWESERHPEDPHSNPQIALGSAIEKVLAQWWRKRRHAPPDPSPVVTTHVTDKPAEDVRQ